MNHRWAAPIRFDTHTTRRACLRCPVVRVTRHEPDNNPRHWTEYHRDGERLTGRPGCQAIDGGGRLAGSVKNA